MQNCTKLLEKLCEFDKQDIPTMYHVTTRSRAEKILKEGLKVSHMGDIHGSMEVQPQEPVLYLSKFPNSNNLNTRLFELNEEIVSLEINPHFIDKNKIYPDDGMFAAIAMEALFEDEEDIQDIFDIPYEEAEILLAQCFNLTNDMVKDWKIFAMWYLITEGEISVAHDLPKEAISFSHVVDI